MHCGSELCDTEVACLDCPACSEISSAPALVFSAVALAAVVTLVGGAMVGLAFSDFWDAAPVLLRRFLNS